MQSLSLSLSSMLFNKTNYQKADYYCGYQWQTCAIYSIVERHTIPICMNHISSCWSFETAAISSHASLAQFVLLHNNSGECYLFSTTVKREILDVECIYGNDR